MPRPFRGERPSLSLRTSPEVREKIAALAAKSGRSISQEAEMVLERGLAAARGDAGKQVLGSSTTPATKDLLTAIASAIANAERLRGTTWLKDASLRRRCNEVVKTLADIMMPDIIGDDRIEEIIADHVFGLRSLQDEEMYAFVKQMTETHGLEMPKGVVVEKDGKETVDIRRLIDWAAETSLVL